MSLKTMSYKALPCKAELMHESQAIRTSHLANWYLSQEANLSKISLNCLMMLLRKAQSRLLCVQNRITPCLTHVPCFLGHHVSFGYSIGWARFVPTLSAHTSKTKDTWLYACTHSVTRVLHKSGDILGICVRTNGAEVGRTRGDVQLFNFACAQVSSTGVQLVYSENHGRYDVRYCACRWPGEVPGNAHALMTSMDCYCGYH